MANYLFCPYLGVRISKLAKKKKNPIKCFARYTNPFAFWVFKIIGGKKLTTQVQFIIKFLK